MWCSLRRRSEDKHLLPRQRPPHLHPLSHRGYFLDRLDDDLAYFEFEERLDFDNDKTPEKVHLLTRPKALFSRDYRLTDRDADNYSIDITRLTHLSAQGHLDKITEFQMVQRSMLDDFIGLEVYKCYLRSPLVFPEDKDNINNWLWMSWNFLRWFDGLNTTTMHEPQVPQIAIRFVKIVEKGAVVKTEDDTEWYRVDVAIECPDKTLFEIMKRQIKEGMIVDEKCQKIVTWVFVQDPTEFIRCLTYKYEETHRIWQKKELGEVVTFEEASDLRRCARVALQARKRRSASGPL